MKKRFLLFVSLLAGLDACHQEKSQPPVVKEPLYQKAESFLDRQSDSAFYYFNKVAGSSRDSLVIAMAYNQMAAIQSDAGDNFGSQESLLTSLKFLNDQQQKNRKCLASDYNELGMTSFNLKNYDAAIGFFDQAVHFSDNGKLTAVVLNNQANAYRKKKDYASALKIYRTAMAHAQPNKTTYARMLTNLAITEWFSNSGYKAAPELLRALQIRQKAGDLWGQNSSYVHLTEYYMHSHPDSALLYAEAMYTVATRIKSPDDRLTALQKLITLAPALSAKHYFTAYQQLNDSIQTARNAAKNQFALIRYDAEKNKLDNLRLQKDNTEKKYQLAKQRLFIYGAILLLLIAVFWYFKRRQRMLLETQNLIKENELKISKKVHDVVANGLYQVMQEVQYQYLQGEPLVGKIDHLYRQSRNISHDMPKSADDFHLKIDNLLQAFKTDERKVLLVLNNEALWEEVNDQVRSEMEYVLQELMVNMSKHSEAQNVVIKFDRQQDDIKIVYTDDGKGIPAGMPFGKGMTNTVSRIRAIRGNITFELNGARGLRVDISFPIA